MTVATEESSRTIGTVPLELSYCDACSAALGLYRVWIDRWRLDENGNGRSLDLVLCGHHASKHRDSLNANGYEIVEV